MELIIKTEKGSSIENIIKAISNIKGVATVSKVSTSKEKHTKESLSPALSKLMGSVTYTQEELDSDPKLAYLYSK